MATTAADLARWKRRRTLVTWILIGILAVGSPLGYAFYKRWRLGSLDEAARAAMSRGDYVHASLKARRALQIDPDRESACAVMAELAERYGDPGAIAWREKLTQLTGGSTASLIAYASAAIKFGRPPTAKLALERVPEADRQTAEFNALTGAVAFESGDFASAQEFFAKAAELDPANPAHQFDLARAQIGSRDFFKQESGRKLLSELANVDAFRLRALRELVLNYQTTGETQAALRESRKLVASSGHSLSDDLQSLQLLLDTKDDGFAAALAAVKQQVSENARDATALLVWMGNVGLAFDGINWALKEVPDVGRMKGIEPALAGCYSILGDWPAVLRITAAGPWPRTEYLRHAYRARAFRAQNMGPNADPEWEAAIDSAAKQSTALAWLARMASEWEWHSAAEKTWWAVLSHAPRETWALESLYRRYLKEKNTSGIRQIASHLLKIEPTNERAQNDFAMSSLLLDREVDRAKAMADSLHKKHPDNVAYASTYAFSLLTEGKAMDALQIFEALPPTQLETPEVAAYYGMVLVANGTPEKARHFLDIARAATLLPEEQAWMLRAERRLSEANRPIP